MEWIINLPFGEVLYKEGRVVVEGIDGTEQEVPITKDEFYLMCFIANTPIEVLSPLYIMVDKQERKFYIGTERHVREKKPPEGGYPYFFMNFLEGCLGTIDEPYEGFIDFFLRQLRYTAYEEKITKEPVLITDVWKVIREPTKYTFAQGEPITDLKNFYVDPEDIDEEESEYDEVEEEYVETIPLGKKSTAVGEQGHVFSVLQLTKKTTRYYHGAEESEFYVVRYAFPRFI